MPTLNVVSGPAAGHQFEVNSERVLGREGADITIPDPEISREHARLRPHDDGIEVVDLGSSNGTFVNDVRVTVPTVVRSGDRVRFGNSTAQLVESRGGTMISPPGAAGSPGPMPGPMGSPPPVVGPTAPHQQVPTGQMPQAGPPMYQPGPHPGPYGAPPRKDNSKKILAIVAGVVGVLVLVVVALFLLGGGGVDNGELIAEGDELCDDAARDVEALAGQQPGEFVRNFADIGEGLTDDLRDLGEPADDAELYEEYLGSLEESTRIVRDAIPAADALDQQGINEAVTESAEQAEESEQLANEFGFEACRGFELTGG